MNNNVNSLGRIIGLEYSEGNADPIINQSIFFCLVTPNGSASDFRVETRRGRIAAQYLDDRNFIPAVWLYFLVWID
jgi:hypothetical protein